MGEPFTCWQLSQEVWHLQQRITELEQLASRYSGAVEVVTQVRSVSYRESGIPTKSYIESPKFNRFIGQRVKVLVMKEDK